MTWYTFLVTANLLVMGWFYSKDVSDHKPLIPVSILFLCLDILGAFSTGLVGYYMAKEVPADFRGLVAWAAGVTSVALLGVGFVWVYLIKITLAARKAESWRCQCGADIPVRCPWSWFWLWFRSRSLDADGESTIGKGTTFSRAETDPTVEERRFSAA
jgi:hypothetical protein